MTQLTWKLAKLATGTYILCYWWKREDCKKNASLIQSKSSKIVKKYLFLEKKWVSEVTRGCQYVQIVDFIRLQVYGNHILFTESKITFLGKAMTVLRWTLTFGLHSVPEKPNNGKKFETIELLLPCGYLSAPQKPNMMILMIKTNFFKNMHFLVSGTRASNFSISQNPDPKSWKSCLCSKRSPILGLSPGAIWDPTDLRWSSNDRLKKKSWGSTDRGPP